MGTRIQIRSLHKMSERLIMSLLAAILILAGCTPQIRQPTKICPGKNSVAEALTALQSHAQNAVPLKAHGDCRLEYYVEGKKKPQRESLNVKLRVNPPDEIYLQGDKPLISKAIVVGSNEQEFWLAIKPEISLYYWGLWSEQDSGGGLVINPRTLLEALGIEQIDAGQDWSLSNEGPFDILTKRERGLITKKIHIFSCDYRVRKTEFFDTKGRAIASAELDRYKEVSEGFFVPALIKVTTFARNDDEDPFSITLNLTSIKSYKKWPSLLFERREPKGFKHVGRIANGKLIEQPQ
jgi:hypothetical protein